MLFWLAAVAIGVWKFDAFVLPLLSLAIMPPKDAFVGLCVSMKVKPSVVSDDDNDCDDDNENGDDDEPD